MSTMNPEHERLRELVAAYALDAVDETEAMVVEDHLRDCPRCRAELAAHQETAALLAHAGGEAPAGVWDRIATSISGTAAAPPLPVTLADRPARAPRRRGTGADRTRRRGWLVGALAGAVAAAAVALLGASLAHQSHRLDRLSAELADQTLLRQATAAALDPRATRVALTSGGEDTAAVAAVLPGGTGYLVVTGLPPLPSTRSYQLWSIVGGRAVSDGLLGTQPHVSRFSTPGGATVLAITDEPARGSLRPTGRPVASGAL